MNKLLNKKGDMNLLFKWIFGIIAGALILAFFVRFSWTHIGGQETIEGNRILLDVDDRLDAFGVGIGSSNLDLKDDFIIGVECNKLTNGVLGETNYFDRLTDKIIFSPGKLNGRNINFFVKEWSYPYDITKVFYLSNPKNRYLIVTDNTNLEEAEETTEKFPLEFNVQLIKKSEFKSENYKSQAQYSDKVTVVYFGIKNYEVNQLKSMWNNPNVEIIEINSKENTAKIHNFYGQITEEFYLGEEMLIGLITAGSNYQCVKERSNEKFKILTKIYSEKISRLVGKTNDEECQFLMSESKKMLDLFRISITKTSFYENKEKIEKQNKILEAKSCPTIY